MADPIDDLIREIAGKHGIAVGRDDPILVLHTVNERLLQDSVTAQQALLDACKTELEALASRWGEEAQQRANVLIDAAVAGSKEAMTAMAAQGAATAGASMQAEVDAALAGVTASVRQARRAAMLTLVAACITLAAAGIALYSCLRYSLL